MIMTKDKIAQVKEHLMSILEVEVKFLQAGDQYRFTDSNKETLELVDVPLKATGEFELTSMCMYIKGFYNGMNQSETKSETYEK